MNVRVSNVGALGLYRDVLGFKVFQEEVEYYADNENAYEMRKYFKPELEELEVKPDQAKSKGRKQDQEGNIGNALDVDIDNAEDDKEDHKEEVEETIDTTNSTPNENENKEDESKVENEKEAETSKKKKKNKRKKRR